MNEAEMLKIMGIIRNVYPRFGEGQDIDAMAATWLLVFSGVSYQEAEAATICFLAEDDKGFPPSPGQIMQYVRRFQEMIAPRQLTEQEAWQMVLRGCSNRNKAAEVFAAFPTLVQQLVGSSSQLVEWSLMPSDSLQTVVASNFMRSYRARAAQQRELESFARLVGVEKLPEYKRRELLGMNREFDELPLVLMEYCEEDDYPLYEPM